MIDKGLCVIAIEPSRFSFGLVVSSFTAAESPIAMLPSPVAFADFPTATDDTLASLGLLASEDLPIAIESFFTCPPTTV